MGFWRREKTPVLTPVEARLQLIGKLKREIQHFEREVNHIELRLQGSEADIRSYTRSRADSSHPEVFDRKISEETKIILGYLSRLAEHRAEIVQRQRRVLNLYDEIDSIYRFGVGPDREEAPARA